MFRLPNAERIDPMEEKRLARENTINSIITFCILCAAIRAVAFGIDAVKGFLIQKPLAIYPCAPYVLEHSGF